MQVAQKSIVSAAPRQVLGDDQKEPAPDGEVADVDVKDRDDRNEKSMGKSWVPDRILQCGPSIRVRRIH